MVNERYLRAVTGAICGFALLTSAQATTFHEQGGVGDFREEYRCPAGQMLVGFFGRTGSWIDQIGLICARFAQPAYAAAGESRLPPRGGAGGGPNEQRCDADSAIRGATIGIVAHAIGIVGRARLDYVGNIKFTCSRPRDGSSAGGRIYGGTQAIEHFSETETIFVQQCPGSEYATGLIIRYGKHVNSAGLICGAFESEPPPAPPPPPPAPSPVPAPAPSQTPPSPPASLTTGTFDSTFGVLELRETEGSYSQKNGHVTVLKTVGNRIKGIWEQSTAAQQCPDGRFWGKFVFTFDAQGFTGTYGYCNGPATAGEWNGTRR